MILPDPHYLDIADLAEVTRNAPIVSVDIIVRNRENKVLLMLRNDEPAKGTFFVPGGRICKHEPMEAAFERVVLREIGRPLRFAAARFRGIYQHFYTANRFGEPGSGTHYVVLAHEISMD